MRTDAPATSTHAERRRISLTGCVQGVGFRPFVYRLAKQLMLSGWVNNTPQGVEIEIEGAAGTIDLFEKQLQGEAPVHARIHTLNSQRVAPLGVVGFEIRESAASGVIGTIPPDLAVCAECAREIFEPQNRRYRYPFTNCTHCGPRFSILERAPYDRANTSMKCFEMCAACAVEYGDPADRRFHAQPNACPACGPQLQLWDAAGRTLAQRDDALNAAAAAIQAGKIVAVKGIGGFQLMVDARSDSAIARLRERKHRDAKPFALMFPLLDAIRVECEVDTLEAELLTSAAAPIVILQRSAASRLPEILAPRHPTLGAMLPYSPLHILLLDALKAPVVATSGNVSDEPICIDEHEALRRLAGLADLFLVHDRPIVRAVDDSVVRVFAGREMMLRRARGYAPLPIRVGFTLPGITAFGAHVKNSVAISRGDEVIVSQHVGDLETAEARAALETTLRDLPRLFEHEAELSAADVHPDYASTRLALRTGAPVLVQHHYAHVLSCMAENELQAPVLGVAWDGAGLGLDGASWGGEFLAINASGFERVAHLRPFLLPGGDAAAREPRRTALGVLYEIFGTEVFERTELAPVQAFSAHERMQLLTVLSRKVNTHETTSIGRLCDAVAALLKLCPVSSFEGQAAMLLEFAIGEVATDASYAMPLRGTIVDWEPAVREILADLSDHVSVALIAAKFHNALVEAIISVARASGQSAVALSGGCFQNKYLTERAVARLRASGFTPYWHRRVPPNDGGIALGQILAAARSLET